MEVEITTLLDSFADLRKRANANACFGKPMTTEGHTVIPVAEVTYEFAMGIECEGVAGEDKDASGGGGMRVRPFAVVEVTPESTRVEPIVDEQKVAWVGGLLIAWAVFWIARTLIKIFGQPK